ncbi:hypothetical protein EUX98_g6846 [Antrodiella citrinella]|uniref:Uncharacterized protein n=1 Tax=Antrodiella citrinella TaxID=2447956 RepID=A0A4S4MQ09_9APHY|nr:hypothetical protein EUX98_g6846 [Antrodiella citrinella]
MNVAIGPRTSTQDGAHPDNHLPKNVTCDAGTEFVNTAHCATCRIGIRMLYFGVQYWGQELEGIIIVLSRVGVDAGAALGVNTDVEDGVLKDMLKSVGRWDVERVDKISVGLSTVAIYSEHGHLADITLPSFTLPLTVNPPPDPTWLTTMSVPVLIKPTKDLATLARFVRNSWRDGVVNVRATVNETVVDALGGWLHLSREHVSSTVRMSLPHLPPPDRVPVHLIVFLIESAATHLALSGNATIENPLPEDMNLHATVPELPFTVFLHAPNDTLAPVANVTTAPITLAHPNVSLAISGFVLPIPPVTQAALSNFISLYLRAQDNPIVISTPFLPGLMFPTTFPAPYPKPQVLRNVTIRNMMLRYSPDGKGGMLASGTVFGRAVLPRGIKVGIDVKRIFPDVLVFDGEVSGSEDDQEETGPPSFTLPPVMGPDPQ